MSKPFGVESPKEGRPNGTGNDTHPEIAKMIGRGSFWVLADRRCLVAQRNSQGRVRVYLTLRADTDWIASCGIPFHSPSKARAALAGLLSRWAPEFTALLAACDDTVIPRPIEALPVGLTWRPTPYQLQVAPAAK